jgi:23S rRNA pseudouridine1911/1915/1917 synthase
MNHESIACIKKAFPKQLCPKILFEDTHLLVLSKPAGLLSQPEHSQSINLVEGLRKYWNRHYVGLIHRLDRNTSGIMIVAKRSKSAQRLTQSLLEGKLIRRYLGLAIGNFTQSARWMHQLDKNKKTNHVCVKPSGKQATLQVAPKKHFFFQNHPITLMEFILETGRSHQIRAQAAHEGFPLLGDYKYGGTCIRFPRIALHSYHLTFPHPMSEELFTFEDALPEDLKIPPLR